MSHAGLYKLYVTNWNGDWTLAIQMEISPVGKYSLVKLDALIVTPVFSYVNVSNNLQQSLCYKYTLYI